MPAAILRWFLFTCDQQAAALQEHAEMWREGRWKATQERSRAERAHSAQVMACAVVSMPAIKKMLSSLHMRVKGSGARAWRCRCMRWLPIEASWTRPRAPLHPPLTPQRGGAQACHSEAAEQSVAGTPLVLLAEPAGMNCRH